MLSDLENLSRLTEIQHLHAQRKLNDLIARETRLRTQIAELRSQVAEVDTERQIAMRQIGADMLWRQWVERMLMQLNTELAQVLAQKEPVLKAVRRSFGRMQVSAKLEETHRLELRKSKAQTELEEAIEASLSAPEQG